MALLAPPLAFDFGPAPTGPHLVHRFRIRNDTPGRLELAGVETPCGCIATELSAKSVPPGESAHLTIRVNTLTQPPGPIQWAGVVRTNAGPRPWKLSATLTAAYSVAPNTLAVSMTAGVSPPPMTVAIRHAGAGGRAVRLAGVTLPFVTAEAGPAGAYSVAVRPDAPPGLHRGDIVFATDDPVCPELRVPMTVECRAANGVEFGPKSLDFELTGAEPRAVRLVQVRARPGVELAIDGASCDSAAVKVTTAASNGRATVRVAVDGGRLPGRERDGDGEAVATRTATRGCGALVHFAVRGARMAGRPHATQAGRADAE